MLTISCRLFRGPDDDRQVFLDSDRAGRVDQSSKNRSGRATCSGAGSPCRSAVAPTGWSICRRSYGDDDPDLGDTLRLGRATDWIEGPDGPVRGVGQRMFLAGQDLISMMDVTEIAFDPPVAAA